MNNLPQCSLSTVGNSTNWRRQFFLGLLLVALTAMPVLADDVAYSNGPPNGELHAWPISSGSVISNSFTVNAGTQLIVRVTAFYFWAWTSAGDSPKTVTWSITSAPNGGITYAGATSPVLSYFVRTNHLGYSVYRVLGPQGPTINLPPGKYWLNLQNGTTTQNKTLYWDENDGVGCGSQGCPSQAFQNSTIPVGSESFIIFSLCPHCSP